ncbi:MAG: glycosyltransferase [Candidatus Omnitrophica bacterium]|nr:glycosyltransferase [Candidatus Omnitrophota bacterium]
MTRQNRGNILFLRRSFPFEQRGDIAHYIHDAQCANAAAELGYDALLVFMDDREPSGELLDLFRYPQANRPKEKFKGFYRVGDKLRLLKLPVPRIMRNIRIKGFGADILSFIWFFYRFLRKDACLAHTQDLLLAEIAVGAGVPVVYEQHYFGKAPFKEKLVQNPLFRLAVVQSDFTKRALISNGMPEEKIKVMHNGFNRNFLEREPDRAEQWRKELLKPEEKHLVVYSGALFDFKGVDILIDIAKDMPDIRFALTGGGDERLAKYRSILKDKDIRNVTFLGWLESQDELTALFQAADVMAHPHHTKHGDYTDPVKFFQYLASGTPIALTDLPFVDEFKGKGFAMEICEPDSAEAYRQCIRKTLAALPRKEEGYCENIEFAKGFTWEKRMEKIFSIAKI